MKSISPLYVALAKSVRPLIPCFSMSLKATQTR